MKSILSLITVCALTGPTWAQENLPAITAETTNQENGPDQAANQEKPSVIAKKVEDLLSPGPNNPLYKEWQ